MQWCGVWIPAPALFLQGSAGDSPGVVAFWGYWTGKYKTRPSIRSQETNQRCSHIPVRSRGFFQITQNPTLWNLWRHAQRYAISCEYLNLMSEVQYMRMLYQLLKFSVLLLIGKDISYLTNDDAVRIAVIRDVTPCSILYKFTRLEESSFETSNLLARIRRVSSKTTLLLDI